MKQETENYIYINNAYVTEYGEFAAEGSLLSFDQSLLNNQQWQYVDELPDSLKFEYVLAILDGDDKYVAELENN